MRPDGLRILRHHDAPGTGGEAPPKPPSFANEAKAGGGESLRRREVLKLLGASSALALGLPGCTRKPRRRIVSRAEGPEYQKPGAALHYASTWTEGDYPYGIVVKTVDGRPVKIEGNPDHPVNEGASSAAMQASLLSLYDPNRFGAPGVGEPVDWAAADARIVAALQASTKTVLVTRATLGPSERDLVARFCRLAPGAVHLVHEAVHDGPRRAAWKALYGADGEVLPNFFAARVILSLDSDFLGTDGAVLENTRHVAARRALDEARPADAAMSRLYVVESTVTVTGSNADHRLALKPSDIARFARDLHAVLAGRPAPADGPGAAFRDAVAADLRDARDAAAVGAPAARGEALVVAGPHLPEAVHATVARINHLLGAPGMTGVWNPAPRTLPVTPPAEVAKILEAGPDVLILLGVNPVYDFPGGGFGDLLGKARLTIGHGTGLDETVSACAIKLPSSHPLESWNDAAPRIGVASLAQPVIAPLYATRQEAESLLRWAQALAPEGDALQACRDFHDVIRLRWGRAAVSEAAVVDAQQIERDRRAAWEEALRQGGRFLVDPFAVGIVREGPFPKPVGDLDQVPAPPDAAADGLELVVRPHVALHDGRFANSAWLQELPDPVTRTVWDDFAALGPETAKRLGVGEGDGVSVRAGGTAVALPVLVQPGQAEGVVALTLGRGRTLGGEVLKAAGGANVAPLLGAAAVQVAKAPGGRRPVRLQASRAQHGRDIVLDGTLEAYRTDAGFVRKRRPPADPPDLYEPFDYSQGPKWAMAIDLNACTGCGACVVACQAENNVGVVGRDECARQREMHWIRIDRYEEADGRVHHLPMLCQHCDHAPCETVCPVYATAHSPEGLNEMTYNRCVGTRYCANNCPYKVRRFNFLRRPAGADRAAVQELARNPQVTVRGPGVMEKCTFCVQRITEAKFRAKAAGKALAGLAVTPACAQACPARAIAFGDANPADGAIAKARASRRGFHVLEMLNVKPNVTYLARVRNPNPALRPAGEGRSG